MVSLELSSSRSQRSSNVSLGLDLSLRATGAIRLEKGKIIGRQLIKSKSKGTKPIDELERLTHIRDSVILDDIKIAVIEGLAFMAKNSTALCQLAGLNYMIREHFSLSEIKFVIVAPTTLKKFVTGKGNCGKDMMLLETYKRYKVSFDDDNLCDAYGLAQIGAAILEEDPKLTKPQKEVIELIKKQL